LRVIQSFSAKICETKVGELMKRYAALFLSCMMAASSMAPLADAQTAPSSSKKPRKTVAKRTGDTAAELSELKAMLQRQQEQINQLQQQLQQRDQALQQTQQQATQAQSAATEAGSKADAANTSASQANESVTAMKSDVTDLKANLTTTALSIQEDQKKFNEATESPIALHYKGVTITPGGFVAAETVTRQRATASDINTPFNSIPFSSANAARTTEFFGSGRQSRLTLKAEGKLKSAKLTGYWEMDWLGVGVTSNANQSNSYVNRQRQLWGQVAMTNGLNITGGQMWSLVTETKKGLDNLSEALPMTIDAQYTVGFSWARQFGFRVTKNFNNKVWVGFSLENPQTTFANPSNSPNNFLLGNFGTNGGLYNGGGGAPAGAALANYSFNAMPDVIVKAAFEPGFGHYEVFGIVSRFRDRIYPNAGATPPSAVGAFNDSVTGGGIGANARFTAKKKFDFGVHFLGGDGVGRYGTSSLPDATVHPDGTLALLHSYQGLGTFEIHTKQWDWYFNGGMEYIGRAAYLNSAGKLVGYGSQTNASTGCSTEPVPGAGGFLPANPGNCGVPTRSLFEGTVGFWFKPYNGPKGRIQFGPQYSYVSRNTWYGTGGSPHAIENMVLTSFRYYLP
jgi:TolA-binding protein